MLTRFLQFSGWRQFLVITLLIATGLLVALYTYGIFGRAMVLGFDWSGSQYQVIWALPDLPVELDDELVQLGPINFAEFSNDLRQPLLDEIRPGQAVPLVVKRDGTLITLSYTPPGATWAELQVRLLSQWWLSWLFGSVALLTYYSLRPKDTRWYLLIAFFCLTAVWLSASTVSRLHLWESAIVLRMAVWLSVPVSWHLHWVFPERQPELRAWHWGRIAGYGGAVNLALLEWFQLLPVSSYLIGFIGVFLGILIPLGIRSFNKSQTRQVRRLWGILLIAVMPLIVLALVAGSGASPLTALVALLGLPALPLGYFYTAYRSQLGWLELRANRFIALGLFGLAVSVVATVGTSILLSQVVRLEIELLDWVLVVGVVWACLAAAVGFPVFQRWVEKNLLGIPTTPRHLLGKFLARINTSLDHTTLIHVLLSEILPSLQVTQSALFLLGDGSKTSCLYQHHVNATLEPDGETVKQFIAQAGQYRLSTEPPLHPEYGWVRLALRLTVEEKDVGVWLLGRRDPDDVYAQAEIEYLQVLANQIALTLKVLSQTEQLRQLYQADIDRREGEQSRLARDLHDLVLNNLAKLRLNSGPEPSPEFMQAYNVAVDSLRQTISNLRPPLLDYGLYEALKALANEHEYGSEELPPLSFEVAPSSERYDAKVEEQIYRIIQQAYENALKHAHAKHLRLAGRLSAAEIELYFEDDGVGFNSDRSGLGAEANAHHHFGLLMMRERAALIGAELTLRSQSGRGTQVRVVWGVPAGG